MTSPAEPSPAPELQPVEVSYEHSQSLPALLEHLELSLLLSTYQAGRVVSVCSHRGELRLGFAHFDQAMGLCRTASGIAVGKREHDIAFLARSCHHSGPLMGHDIVWLPPPPRGATGQSLSVHGFQSPIGKFSFCYGSN